MPDAKTPYNFVPLPDAIVPGEQVPDASRFDAARHTGWLEVGYQTLTPIYTRAAWPVKGLPCPTEKTGPDDRRQSADFFHQDETRAPVLPGSSLRGMFRSVFEVITGSRMEFYSDRRLFFRSFAAPRGPLRPWADLYRAAFDVSRLFAGRLEPSADGGWALRVADVPTSAAHPSDRRGFVVVAVRGPGLPDLPPGLFHASGTIKRGRTSPKYEAIPCHVDLHGAVDVSLLRVPHQFQVLLGSLTATGGVPGWLIVPGPDVQYRHYYQFVLDPGSGPCREYHVPADVRRDYETWGDLAHGGRFGTAKAPRELAPGKPAFALADRTNREALVIGANMMMPMRYEQSIRAVTDRSEPPRGPDPDMTQVVFGNVAARTGQLADGGNAIKGRVFFEDARTDEPHPWLASDPAGNGVRTPDILSTPKPTSFQTYLEQPDPHSLHHWDTPDRGPNKGARVRGTKRYWHRSAAAAGEGLRPDPAGAEDTQRTRIRPVREAVQFSGRIRFENLTDAELGALYAAVQLPQGLAHKFGMGKSLGLGSLKVTVTERVLLDPGKRYTSLAQSGAHDDAATRTKLETAYQAFVRRVATGAQSLWAAPRMRALAALLAWERRPADGQTRMVGVDNDPERQWRDRLILPEAVNVGPGGAGEPVQDVLPPWPPGGGPVPGRVDQLPVPPPGGGAPTPVEDQQWPECQVKIAKGRKGSIAVHIQHGDVSVVVSQSDWTRLEKGWTRGQRDTLRKTGIRATVRLQIDAGNPKVVAVTPEP
jgi:hypothetical protein